MYTCLATAGDSCTKFYAKSASLSHILGHRLVDVVSAYNILFSPKRRQKTGKRFLFHKDRNFSLDALRLRIEVSEGLKT